MLQPKSAALQYTGPQPELTTINNIVQKLEELHVKNSIPISNKLLLDSIK